MLSRRTFLQSSALVALAPTVPSFLAQTARAARTQRDSRVLVVVQLDGGNDGINTVVPYADEGYARYRKHLRLPTARLHRINDKVGLHPALGDAARLLQSGRLAIVQGVGYPNPSRSHFRSMAIWQTAQLDPRRHGGVGWLGASLERGKAAADGAPPSLLVGLGSPPAALRSTRSVSAALAHLEDLHVTAGADLKRAILPVGPGNDLKSFVRRSMLDAYTTGDRLEEAARVKESVTRYPATGLAEKLRLIAWMVKAGFGTRVYYATQATYDTHRVQLPEHARLLGELGGALRAFLDDLKAAGAGERVLVLVFSEFGRRVQENGSHGTDHGTAAPVFLAGACVRPGLVGKTPRLLDLEDGDLKMGIDFRRVYASVLEDWLGIASRPALGAAFERLPLLVG